MRILMTKRGSSTIYSLNYRGSSARLTDSGARPGTRHRKHVSVHSEKNLQEKKTDLMSDNQDVFLSFQFHDNRFQPDNDIAIRLPATIPVIEFIIVSCLEIFRILFLQRHSRSVCGPISKTQCSPQFLHRSFRHIHLRLAHLMTSMLASDTGDSQPSVLCVSEWMSTPVSCHRIVSSKAERDIGSNLP